MLFVQPKQGQEVTEQEILAYVTPLITERAAVPKAVHILTSLPRSGPGKISKLALRRTLARDVLQGEVDAIAGEGAATIIVGDDPLTGVIAEIEPMRPIPDDVRRSVDGALGRYSIAHRWIEGVIA